MSDLEAELEQGEAEPVKEAEKPTGDAGPEEWVRYFGDECGTVRVYRKDPQGKYELLETYAADTFSEPLIADQYGGGIYQARLCAVGAGGYLKQTLFRIAGDPREEEPLPPRVAAAPSAPGAHVGNSAADMMASAVMLATSMQQAQTTLLVPLLEALADRGGGSSGGLQDMDAMFSIMERMQDRAGERGGGDDIIKTLGMPLLAQIQKLAEREKGGQPAPAPAPDIAPAAELAAGPAPGWVTALRPYVEELTQLAAFQGDPVYWSRTILAKVSDAEFLFLEEEAGRDGFPDEFHTWFPGTVQHRPWFARFWAEMVEAVKEARAEDPGGEEKRGQQADAV